MGRPLNKKYFGNTNAPDFGTGGEGVASVTVVTGDSLLYDAADTVSFTAPQIGGGATATGTIQVDVGGAVTGILVTSSGSGYTSAPTVTITTSTGTQTTLTLTAVLTSGAAARQNAISMTAFLTGGSAVAVDIIRQVSTDRYKVTDGTRTGVVQLQSTLANAAGEGSIAATDSAGGQYFVTKLTAHKATVTRAGGSNWLYANNEAAPWKFDTAAGIYLQIANA
jgi:hypothetical protein